LVMISKLMKKKLIFAEIMVFTTLKEYFKIELFYPISLS